MLEKEPNNPRCHCLCILALFESDLNHAKRVIIGRRLLNHMNDSGMLPAMQHGSVPGKHYISAVIKKELCHDHLRLTKSSGAFHYSPTTGDNTLPDTVPRIEPTQGFRTLGVYLTPSGQYNCQAKILRQYAEQFKQQI
jgi:hypothetical protein